MQCFCFLEATLIIDVAEIKHGITILKAGSATNLKPDVDCPFRSIFGR